jgi:hypothetical protein
MLVSCSALGSSPGWGRCPSALCGTTTRLACCGRPRLIRSPATAPIRRKQLRQLNRIVALKDLGLTLGQIRQLLDGITVDELRGMLLLRRAQLEGELQRQRDHLLGVEARLRHIAQEDEMPADDIVVKQIPPLGVASPQLRR